MTQEINPKEIPRYKLTEKCYLNDRLYEPPSLDEEMSDENPRGSKPLIISWTEKPAYYMEPINNAAKEMVAKYPPAQFVDPIQQLNIVGVDRAPSAPLTAADFASGMEASMQLLGDKLASVFSAKR